jgi:hypothetical protein
MESLSAARLVRLVVVVFEPFPINLGMFFHKVSEMTQNPEFQTFKRRMNRERRMSMNHRAKERERDK